jgi:hypothetical protein
MPRGRPRKQPEGRAGTNDKRISKMEAVRRALSKLGRDAKPSAIQDFIRSQFQIHMETNMISNYKSHLSKKAAGRSRMTRRPAGQAAVARATRAAAGSGITLEDVRAVKELTDRMGADKVRELAGVLSE